MKVRVKFKDPDTMQDSVQDVAKHMPKPDGVTEKEWAPIREARALEANQMICEDWMEYGEYLEVEFDTTAHTATVLKRGSIK